MHGTCTRDKSYSNSLQYTGLNIGGSVIRWSLEDFDLSGSGSYEGMSWWGEVKGMGVELSDISILS